jgi:hypothetical protein
MKFNSSPLAVYLASPALWTRRVFLSSTILFKPPLLRCWPFFSLMHKHKHRPRQYNKLLLYWAHFDKPDWQVVHAGAENMTSTFFVRLAFATNHGADVAPLHTIANTLRNDCMFITLGCAAADAMQTRNGRLEARCSNSVRRPSLRAHELAHILDSLGRVSRRVTRNSVVNAVSRQTLATNAQDVVKKAHC